MKTTAEIRHGLWVHRVKEYSKQLLRAERAGSVEYIDFWDTELAFAEYIAEFYGDLVHVVGKRQI